MILRNIRAFRVSGQLILFSQGSLHFIRHVGAIVVGLSLFSATSQAALMFESVTFGKLSTHCNSKNSLVNIVSDGSGVSLQFDNMQAGAGMNAQGPNRVRCDLSLKLAEPLKAPATIQAGVSGLLQLTGHGAASASISLDGHK